MPSAQRSARDHCSDEKRHLIANFNTYYDDFFFYMASLDVEDNRTLSNEVLESHEICILRGFLSGFHPCIVGGCSGLTVSFPGSLLIGGIGESIPRLKHEVWAPLGYLRGSCIQ